MGAGREKESKGKKKKILLELVKEKPNDVFYEGIDESNTSRLSPLYAKGRR